MNILLTGSKGFIGKNFVNTLYKKDIKFREYDIVNGYKNAVDLDFDGITHCIHLGAHSSTTETDIKKVLDNNLTWAIQLFEECARRKIHFQWSSSASVYGKRNSSDGAFKISDPCWPQNIYASSKYLLEQYIIKSNSTVAKQGFRYFNVYGEHEDHKANQASPYHQFTKQAKETGIIRVFEGSENYFRDFVSVESVIQTHLFYLEKKCSGLYNIGSGKPKSFLQVAEEIAKMYDACIETIPFPEHLKTHYQTYTCADMSETKVTK